MIKLQEVGKTYGSLIVVSPAASRHGKAYWRCRCACESIAIVKGADLRTGRVTSCGCQSEAKDAPKSLASAFQRIEALEAQLAALPGGAAPAPQLRAPAAEPQPPEQPPEQPSGSTQGSVYAARIARVQHLLEDTPFIERGGVRPEIEELLQQCTAAFKSDCEIIERELPAWNMDEALCLVNETLLHCHREYQKFHIHPKDR